MFEITINMTVRGVSVMESLLQTPAPPAPPKLAHVVYESEPGNDSL